MKPIVSRYLEQLRDYCNKYDNIIMNQVYALGGAEEIFLSDIYSDFDLISKDEYDRNIGIKDHSQNGGFQRRTPDSSTNSSGFDIDRMIQNIDKKIYELNVSELVDKPGIIVKKSMLYVYVKSVDAAHNLVCLTKKNVKDANATERTIKIQDDGNVTSKIHNKWFWIRGYDVFNGNSWYMILEPHWYKTNEELTQLDILFLKSKDIIESTGDKEKLSLIEDDVSSGDKGKSFFVEDDVISVSEKNENIVESIAGSVILSEPGGGKTTFLKHLLYEICDYALSEEERFVQDIIEKGLIERDKTYIPILVRTRDISSLLEDDICIDDIFDPLLEYGISNIIGKDNAKEIINVFIKEISEDKKNKLQLLFVIDGFEELEDQEAEILLSGLLKAYETKKIDPINDRLIISSRHKEYGYQRLVDFCAKHNIEEKYIVFSNKNNAIDNCISNWFKKFKQNAEDNKNYFVSTFSSNSDIRSMIHTPLELTGLIMLCQSQSALPTDITVLYRSIMEIWLTYAIKENSSNIPFFSLSDIFLELSSIAYYMAESEDERLRISQDKMIQIIKKSRKDLRRYYRSNSYVEASSKEELGLLLDFWLRRNIFVKNSKDNVYEFAHREYQSYLISYAIVNNFIFKDKRSSNRLDYFQSHMDSAEDFWDRVIIFAAFMSPDIHDSLIEYIFEKLTNYEEDADNIFVARKIDKYYLGLLLQLTNAEGFYFADYEYEQLFDEIFKPKTDRVNMLKKSVKGSEIKKLLSNGRKETNTIFLQKAVQTYESLDAKGQGTLADIVGNLIFHVVWNCDAEIEMMKKAFSVYLGNWITMDMVYEIKKGIESNNYNKERVKLIRECGLEAISRENNPMSDCYMIISIMMGFLNIKDDGSTSLYKAALLYFEKAREVRDAKENIEAKIIAINLVFLITWFIQSNESVKCGCSLKKDNGAWNDEFLKDYKECILNIVEYMKEETGNHFFGRDLYAVYRDLCVLKKNNIENEIRDIIFDESVLLNCLYLCVNEKLTKETDEKELSYILEIIANYPVNETTMEFFSRESVRDIWKEKTSEIKEYYEKQLNDNVDRSNQNLRKTAYLLKLLIFAGYFNRESMRAELVSQITAIRKRLPIPSGLDVEYFKTLQKEVSDYFKISLIERERNNLSELQVNAREEQKYDDLMKFMDEKISGL